MKQYGGVKKWTKGRSRIVRPSNLTHEKRGLIESLKMAMDKLTPFERKKRSWQK